MTKYKMYLVLGDWSGDGHSQSDKILVETNHPVEDIQQAYKDSCKFTGVEFNHNESYTGITRNWEERKKYSVCTEYGSSRMSKEVYDILSKYDGFFDLYIKGYNGEYYVPYEGYADLWFWFVKLSLPDLDYNFIPEDNSIPYINGYWNKNLNVQFGYGLYS